MDKNTYSREEWSSMMAKGRMREISVTKKEIEGLSESFADYLQCALDIFCGVNPRDIPDPIWKAFDAVWDIVKALEGD